MREKGKSEEEIAVAFFVSANVVKQRIKLAAISPSLLDAYAEEEMTLDQLMAFQAIQPWRKWLHCSLGSD